MSRLERIIRAAAAAGAGVWLWRGGRLSPDACLQLDARYIVRSAGIIGEFRLTKDGWEARCFAMPFSRVDGVDGVLDHLGITRVLEARAKRKERQR